MKFTKFKFILFNKLRKSPASKAGVLTENSVGDQAPTEFEIACNSVGYEYVAEIYFCGIRISLNVLLFIVTLSFFISCSKSHIIVSYYGNTIGNLNNDGLICEYKDNIYYTNHIDNEHLYKTDGIINKKLSSTYAYNINVINNYVYYTAGSPGKVHKVRTDGLFDTTIITQEVYYLIVTDKCIFYQLYNNKSDVVQLYKSDLNGFGKKLILNGIDEFIVYKDNIYYINNYDNDKLYVMNINDGNKIKLLNMSILSLSIWNNNLYFTTKENFIFDTDNLSSKLYALNIDTNDVTFITNTYCENINIYNNYLFYRNQSDKGSLYKMNLSTNENIKLVEGNITTINIYGGTITYRYVTEENGKEGFYKCDIDGNNEEKFLQ